MMIADLQIQKKLTEKIIDAAHEVHTLLGGPGLLETIYECSLSQELELQGIQRQRQVPVPVFYKSHEVREPLFLDMIIEDQIIIEVKATGKDYPYYHAQLSTYLRLCNKPFGLLINFGKKSLKDGITQIFNPM